MPPLSQYLSELPSKLALSQSTRVISLTGSTPSVALGSPLILPLLQLEGGKGVSRDPQTYLFFLAIKRIKTLDLITPPS